MWSAAVPFFDDENEAELKRQFVEFSARYPDQTIFSITQYIFRSLRDPEARANQAALVWSNDLEIKERIRKAKMNGGAEPESIDDDEAYYREVLAEARNPENSAAVRYKYHELAAKLKGRIKEPADAGKSDDSKRALPTFVFAQYPD
jgi:hypothetical protein